MTNRSTSYASVATLIMGLCVLAFVRTTDASAFRGHRDAIMSMPGSAAELERALLNEIEEVLGKDHRHGTERRLARIEASLRPTFAALPKNENGRLDHAAVRYAMHRLFVQRHAWFVTGLDPQGEAWNASSPTAVLQDHVPEYLTNLFEERIGNHGFGIHDLAIMAATLENLVHHEAIKRLDDAYKVLERSPHDPVSPEESREVVDTYMTSYILGFNFSAMTPTEVQTRRSRINEIYPGWPETQKFLRDVEASTMPTKHEELTYENVASIITEIGERYGRWQDHECRSLKNELVEIEDQGTGRVRLADFYGSALHDGKWQFSESVSYLRELGALDESDPNNLRVIIPNYIGCPSNCLASSKYYSVCCLDECEDLLGHIEEKLGAPEATPSEIAAIVANLPSATVPSNRTLSPSLLSRLDEIAQFHGDGHIPLHGRLFSQWMHNAYPRECKYPHVTGTTNPQRAEEWISSQKQAKASKTDMQKHIESAPARSPSAGGIEGCEEAGMCGHWNMEEELVVARPTVRARPVKTVIRNIAFIVVAISSLFGVMRTWASALPSKQDKYALPKYC